MRDFHSEPTALYHSPPHSHLPVWVPGCCPATRGSSCHTSLPSRLRATLLAERQIPDSRSRGFKAPALPLNGQVLKSLQAVSLPADGVGSHATYPTRQWGPGRWGVDYEAQTLKQPSVMSTYPCGGVLICSSCSAQNWGDTVPACANKPALQGDTNGETPLISIQLQIVLSAEGIIKGCLRTQQGPSLTLCGSQGRFFWGSDVWLTAREQEGYRMF